MWNKHLMTNNISFLSINIDKNVLKIWNKCYLNKGLQNLFPVTLSTYRLYSFFLCNIIFINSTVHSRIDWFLTVWPCLDKSTVSKSLDQHTHNRTSPLRKFSFKFFNRFHEKKIKWKMKIMIHTYIYTFFCDNMVD